MHEIVILGGGTGGTLTANRLRRAYGRDEAAITVIDQDDAHVYQPGLLFVPFGLTQPEDLTRPRGRQLRAGIGYRTTGVDHVDVAERSVVLSDGSALPYDVLVVATGSVLAPDGFLYIGHSENLGAGAADFRLVGKTIYQPKPANKARDAA